MNMDSMTMTYPYIVPPDLRPGRYTLALGVLAWDGKDIALAHTDDLEVVNHRMLATLGDLEVTAARR